MKVTILLFLLGISFYSAGQELYVFSDPASNIPARSLSLKFSGHTAFKKNSNGNLSNRFITEAMAGLSKNWMTRFYASFGNMQYLPYRGLESAGVTVKFRFLSNDEVHRHFRMAAFLSVARAHVPYEFDELNLKGDNSGVEGGIIATQLWNRFALSATVGHVQAFDSSRRKQSINIDPPNYQAMNYTLSGGYLVLPREYTDYRQTNFNVYTEVLAQQAMDNGKFYIDIAPAVQLIFNSNSKLNIGYRFELWGDMKRMNRNSWLVSFERTFLNVFRKKV